MSDKTHVKHNESALILIADIPGDMDFRCNGPPGDLTYRNGNTRPRVASGAEPELFDYLVCLGDQIRHQMSPSAAMIHPSLAGMLRGKHRRGLDQLWVTRQRISMLCLSGTSGGMSGRSKAEWGVKRATPFTCESYCLKTSASLRSISEK